MSISAHATVDAPGKCACPSCGAKLTVHTVRAGKSFQCPKCLNAITLPSPATPSEAPAAHPPQPTESDAHLKALNQALKVLRQENAELQTRLDRLDTERAEVRRRTETESPTPTSAPTPVQNTVPETVKNAVQDSADAGLQRLFLENANLVKELADARAAVDDLSRVAARVLGLEGRITDMGRKYIEATTRVQELELALARRDLADQAPPHLRPDA